MQNGTTTLEHNLVVSHKATRSVIIWSSDHTSRYLPSLSWNLCPYKNLHTKVYNSFIHDGEKLEATKVSFSGYMSKQSGVYPYSGIVFSDKKKWATKPQKDMEES